MQARSPESSRTRPPERREAGAVAVIVCAGLALAVALALAVVTLAPERTVAGPPMKVVQPVEFEVLDQGANIAELGAGATTCSFASPVTEVPAAGTENGPIA